MHIVHNDYNKIVNTVSEFKSFLGQYSDVWKKRYISNENISIVLFSCETGVNDGQGESFAQKVSNELVTPRSLLPVLHTLNALGVRMSSSCSATRWSKNQPNCRFRV